MSLTRPSTSIFLILILMFLFIFDSRSCSLSFRNHLPYVNAWFYSSGSIRRPDSLYTLHLSFWLLLYKLSRRPILPILSIQQLYLSCRCLHSLTSVERIFSCQFAFRPDDDVRYYSHDYRYCYESRNKGGSKMSLGNERTNLVYQESYDIA